MRLPPPWMLNPTEITLLEEKMACLLTLRQ